VRYLFSGEVLLLEEPIAHTLDVVGMVVDDNVLKLDIPVEEGRDRCAFLTKNNARIL
jgi:hypothetical protein